MKGRKRKNVIEKTIKIERRIFLIEKSFKSKIPIRGAKKTVWGLMKKERVKIANPKKGFWISKREIEKSKKVAKKVSNWPQKEELKKIAGLKQ